MRIRRADRSDLAAVAAISGAQPRSAGWTRKQFEEELDSSRALFLVLEEAAVRGYVVFKLVEDEARLVDLAVDPSDARKGLARRLLEEAFVLLEREKIGRVSLEVSAENLPARRLYESQGFAVVGRRKKFYNDGSDAILMDLILQ